MSPGRPRKPAHRVKHGTYNGYQWHMKHKEPLCNPCRAANAEYMRVFRKKKRDERRAIASALMGGRTDHHHPTDEEVDAAIAALRKQVKNGRTQVPSERVRKMEALPPGTSLAIYGGAVPDFT